MGAARCKRQRAKRKLPPTQKQLDLMAQKQLDEKDKRPNRKNEYGNKDPTGWAAIKHHENNPAGESVDAIAWEAINTQLRPTG